MVPKAQYMRPGLSLDPSIPQGHLKRYHDNLGTRKGKDAQSRLCFTQRSKTIWQIESVQEFKTAFVDVIDCHHDAYKLGMLPCKAPPVGVTSNPPVNNHGARPRVNAGTGCAPLNRRGLDGAAAVVKVDKTSDQDATGILIDLDLGLGIPHPEADDTPIPRPWEKITEATFETMEHPRRRPSCRPSYQLAPPRNHLYRHDLESFFYILVWVMVHCDLYNHRQLKPHKALRNWQGVIRGADRYKVTKHDLLSGIEFQPDHLWDIIQEPFTRLADEWIVPLLTLYWDAYDPFKDLRACTTDEARHLEHCRARQLARSTDAWKETLGGCITYDRFKAAIGQM